MDDNLSLRDRHGYGERLTFKLLIHEENGGRPGLFDAACLTTRYQSEFAMIEMPGFVRHVVIPIVYALGTALGKYEKFRDAPPPVTRAR